MLPYPIMSAYGATNPVVLNGTFTLVSTNTSTSRYQFGCVSLGTNIYALGGKNNNVNLNSFVKYDTSTNSFSTLNNSLPGARHGMGLCVYNSQLYMFGGNTGVLTNDFFLYDPGTDTWSTITGDTGRPSARHTCRLMALDNGTFVLWGSDGGAQTYGYNPVSKIWSTLASSPYANTYDGDMCTDGVNCYGIQTSSTAFMKYNVQSNTWSTLSTGSGVYGSLCYNGGNVYCYKPNGILYRFNFSTNLWVRINAVTGPGLTMNMLISLTRNASYIYSVLGAESTGVYRVN